MSSRFWGAPKAPQTYSKGSLNHNVRLSAVPSPTVPGYKDDTARPETFTSLNPSTITMADFTPSG